MGSYLGRCSMLINHVAKAIYGTLIYANDSCGSCELLVYIYVFFNIAVANMLRLLPSPTSSASVRFYWPLPSLNFPWEMEG